MKFWQGFFLLWLLFFSFIFFGSIFGENNSITGYIPFTGVLKEDSSVQVIVPDLNVSFELGEGPFYRLWDVNYFINFQKQSQFDAFVELNYLIFDKENNLLYSDGERVLVEGDMEIERNLDTRKAQELALPSGEYVFVLRVIYGENENSFSENFEIKELSNLLYSLRQLFDIRIELYSSSFYDLDEFGVIVTFESFGSEPTPVNLTYMIYDSKGNQIYRKDVQEVVETEKVLFEEFEGLDIEPGKYTLVLRTLYNVNVEDYFEQDFEYLEKQSYWFLVIIALVVFAGLFFLFRKKIFGGSK